MALVRCMVGSVWTFSYMVSSERWSKPSMTVSSTTIPEPLSALLMTKVLSEQSCLRALVCVGVRLGVTFMGLTLFICVLTLSRRKASE